MKKELSCVPGAAKGPVWSEHGEVVRGLSGDEFRNSQIVYDLIGHWKELGFPWVK